MEAVKASGTAGLLNDKALKQTVIPFAKMKASEAERGGLQVSWIDCSILKTLSTMLPSQQSGQHAFLSLFDRNSL